MKKILAFTIILLLLLLLLPLSTLKDKNVIETPSAPVGAVLEIPKTQEKTFKVLITDTNEIKEMPINEYIFGVVAGEMPALYEIEALKAQAVCAYTFALYRKQENSAREYDITDNFKTDQCYISREKAIEKWGEKAEEYQTKLETAISQTATEALTYNGEIILSVYHAVSFGATESAKNVWGKDYPYLQSVDSIGDKLAKNYISSAAFTEEQLKTILNTSEITKNPFTDFTRTEAGAVKTVKACDKEYTGQEIREMFDLKSANFETEFKDKTLTFTVYGYGHGVGMSQNGANYMAQQGSGYKEILLHYYKNCEIKTIQ